MRLSTLIALAALAITPVGSSAVAAVASPEVSVAADRLAANGYDVTAYFTQGKAVPGSAAFEVDHSGATRRFASAESKAAFEADPASYAPQFGGYCAWAVSRGYVAPGDAEQWAIVDGKLYLNFNARAKELWDADRAEAIMRGVANWPAVLTKNQNTP